MSKSAVVAFVVGVLLVAGLVVLGLHDKAGLMLTSKWSTIILFAVVLYAAVLAAWSLHRIANPKLPVPIIAWIAVVGFWIMAALGKKDDQEPGVFGTNKSTDTNKSESDSMGLGWAIMSTVLAVGTYAGGLALLHHFATTAVAAPAVTTSTTKASAPAAPTPGVKPAVGTPMETVAGAKDIMQAPDLAAAIDIARPGFTDVRDDANAGAKALAKYIATLKWGQLSIAKNETTPAQVEKDPMKVAGKRLCASGVLARIEKLTVDGVDLFVARLVTKENDALEVFAVRDSGNLVKRKPAKFCGVVTGRFDATGRPATFAVGMFDVPANR